MLNIWLSGVFMQCNHQTVEWRASMARTAILACLLVLFPSDAASEDQSSEAGLVATMCGRAIEASGNRCAYSDYKLDRKGLLECDGEQCCGYSGRMEYDGRYNRYQGGYVNGFNGLLETYDHVAVGKGSCVRGKANGVWTEQRYEVLETEQAGGEQGVVFEPSALVSGRYQFGLPVGGHTIVEGGITMKAACYIRSRTVEGGRVKYESMTLWDLNTEPPSGEPPLLPEKPDLASFFPELEKPEKVSVLKPSREEYFEPREFRQAMKDYRYELKVAKAAYREAQKVYRAQYKAHLPTAQAEFAQAMREYRESLKVYKAEMRVMRASGKKLQKMAGQCPKITNDYCDFTGECRTEGKCVFNQSFGSESMAAASAERSRYRAVGYGATLASEACMVKQNRHCKRSLLCSEQGRCFHQAGTCVAKREKDCKASSRCKDNALCVLSDGACKKAAPKQTTNSGAESDAAEPLEKAPKSVSVHPKVAGGLDAETVKRHVHQRRSQYQFCYSQQLQRFKNLKGTVKIAFIISASGKVAKAQMRSSTLENKAVESCVRSVTASIRFPAPKGGGIVKVLYPFNFNPPASAARGKVNSDGGQAAAESSTQRRSSEGVPTLSGSDAKDKSNKDVPLELRGNGLVTDTKKGGRSASDRSENASGSEAEALLKTLSGGKTKKASKGSESVSDPLLPNKLSRRQVLSVIRRNASLMRRCRNRRVWEGVAKIQFVVGGNGRVSKVRVMGILANSDIGQCLSRVLKKTRFPQFSGEPQRITFPIRL